MTLTKEERLKELGWAYTKCPKCARIFDEYSKYCNICGTKLKSSINSDDSI